MPDTGFHRSGRLIGQLVGMIRLVHEALSEATAALLDTDVAAADSATAAEKTLYELREEIEDDAPAVLSSRPRGETAVHAIVVGVHVGTDVECLAELARELVELAWSRQPQHPLPARLRLPLRGMANVALTMVARAGEVLESTDVEVLADLLAGQHEMAQRQRLLYQQLLRAALPGELEPGDIADTTLLSCYYDRCASYAVSMARQAGLFADSAPAD